MRNALILVMVAACGGGSDGPPHIVDAHIDSPLIVDSPTIVDAKPDGPSGPCNPLTQQGCAAGDKCTWLLDALAPSYAGHIGCAPAGVGLAGDSCMFGAPGVSGFDNCAKGLVCGDYRGGTGICKQICDQQGGTPTCGAGKVCVTYSGLFSTGSTTPAAGGVCDLGCDPLADNDFDGPGTALTRTGVTCSGTPQIGCYGYPSFGTVPATGWSCTADINYGGSLFHRVQCTDVTGCADPGPTIYVNSCNQGYLPLLRESTMVSTAVCVALCRPHNCYQGNCGTNDDFRLGDSPHRCDTTDARGTFDTSPGGEHCRYLWSFEIDDMGNFLRSPTSDTVGFCFDHSKYLYDSNNDNTPDTPYPACGTLPILGSGTNWGAADLGCVDSTTAGLAFTGKPRVHVDNNLRPLFQPQRAP